MATKTAKKADLDELFRVGAQYGYSKTRRHPSTDGLILGAKNRTEIIDLEKTAKHLAAAKDFVAELAGGGASLLFVGTKPEAKKIVEDAALSIGAPYMVHRWIGGLLTNFKQMRKRIDRLEKLQNQKESGELDVFTKHEQLLIDREVEGLRKDFGGVAQLKGLPGALFVVDPREEKGAVKEAKMKGIPIVALASTDCDISKIDYPIPANDSAIPSIEYFVKEIAESYKKGQNNQPASGEAQPASA